MVDSLTFRAATPEDYAHYVRFFAELGVDDPVPVPERWQRDLLPTTLFCEVPGTPPAVVGYAFVKVLGAMGYVVHVVVDGAWRGRGVGRAVMHTVATHLSRHGCTRWCLNVRADNDPAIRLYERCGMRVAHRSTALSLAWDDVAKLPRPAGAPATVRARPVVPLDDAALEGAFALPAGRIAELRGRAGVIVVRLVDAARPDEPRVGVAAFDPTRPGAFPFAVAGPQLAAPLLDALRPHARPSDSHVKLVIEGDPPTADALRAAGATVDLEMLHMQGDLPAVSAPA